MKNEVHNSLKTPYLKPITMYGDGAGAEVVFDTGRIDTKFYVTTQPESKSSPKPPSKGDESGKVPLRRGLGG